MVTLPAVEGADRRLPAARPADHADRAGRDHRDKDGQDDSSPWAKGSSRSPPTRGDRDGHGHSRESIDEAKVEEARNAPRPGSARRSPTRKSRPSTPLWFAPWHSSRSSVAAEGERRNPEPRAQYGQRSHENRALHCPRLPFSLRSCSRPSWNPPEPNTLVRAAAFRICPGRTIGSVSMQLSVIPGATLLAAGNQVLVYLTADPAGRLPVEAVWQSAGAGAIQNRGPVRLEAIAIELKEALQRRQQYTARSAR